MGSREAGARTCQYLSGKQVDATIAELVIKAFEPAQLELAEANFKHLEAEKGTIRAQWKLQLQEAEKEATKAGQLFKKAALQNRHVAGKLQDEWEQALQHVEKLKQTEGDLPSPPSPEVLAATVKRLSAAAQNLEVVWHASSTAANDRKQLTRLLIKDVILLRKPDLVHMTIRWIAGGRLDIDVPSPSFPRSHLSDSEVIEIIKEMASTHPDRVIAERLNTLGYRGKSRQQKFTSYAVHALRRYRSIPGCPDMCADNIGPRADGRYKTRDVARMLRRCPTYIGQLCKKGTLDAIRSGPKSPWWIKIDSSEFEQFQGAMQKRKSWHGWEGK